MPTFASRKSHGSISLQFFKPMLDYPLIIVLLIAAVYFTFATRGVQFTMIGHMFRLLVLSGKKHDGNTDEASNKTVSSFQAFMISIASRVGTGNLAGVATAIALGGPGAIFWMWVIALLGGATAFVESTLAQLFKVRGEHSFMGGPAYYIQNGLGKRWWAILFAVLITITFGLAFNSVQSNTIAAAFENTFGIAPAITAVVLGLMTLIIIWGGIQSIARFCQIVVPVMAIAYIVLACVVICLNITRVPEVLALIIENAFGFGPAMGGTMGMAVVMGVKRGLFSNEAGEGSTPNAAATATVTHPVKQGLIQTLGVFTDTLIICTCTAFIILCSGVYGSPDAGDGIVLTQQAIDAGIGTSAGSVFVAIAIFFFAFTSIIANYYYGETNLLFIRRSKTLIAVYRICVTLMVALGSVASLATVWNLADITMALMTFCNIAAIAVLGKYAVVLLDDYKTQLRTGRNPVYKRSLLPHLNTPSW